MKLRRIARSSFRLFDRKPHSDFLRKVSTAVRCFVSIAIRCFVGLLIIAFLTVVICDIFLFADERVFVDKTLDSIPPSVLEVSVETERLFYVGHGGRRSFVILLARDIVTRDVDPKKKPSLMLWYLRPPMWALLMWARYDSHEVIAVYRSVVWTKEGQGIDLLSRRMFEKNFTDLTIEEAAEVLVAIRLPFLVRGHKMKEYARNLIARAQEID